MIYGLLASLWLLGALLSTGFLIENKISLRGSFICGALWPISMLAGIVIVIVKRSRGIHD